MQGTLNCYSGTKNLLYFLKFTRISQQMIIIKIDYSTYTRRSMRAQYNTKTKRYKRNEEKNGSRLKMCDSVA